MRKKHLTHEASVKSIGTLYYLAGLFMAIVAIIVVFKSIMGPGPGKARMNPMAPIIYAAMDAFVIALTVGQFFVANGLRRLQGWARIACGIISGLGLLGFPLGTIVNGYILYLVFSTKGRTVFSPEYQIVIQQTPHIKYKTSIVVWIFVGLLLLLLALAGWSVISRQLTHG
jgi:hypothetical protein